MHYCQAHNKLLLPEGPWGHCCDQPVSSHLAVQEKEVHAHSHSLYLIHVVMWGKGTTAKSSAEMTSPVEKVRSFPPAWVCLCAGNAMLSVSEPGQGQCQENLSSSLACSFSGHLLPLLSCRRVSLALHSAQVYPAEATVSRDMLPFSEAPPSCLLVVWHWAALGSSEPPYRLSSEFPLKSSRLMLRSRAFILTQLGHLRQLLVGSALTSHPGKAGAS